MGKYKYLLKNLGIMTLSNFGSKILSFLMVPVYTRVLTTAEYGTYDFYVTTILLLTPLLSMNILDAVIRFTLDKNSNSEQIFSIGLKFCIRAILICASLLIINQFIGIIPLFTEYPIYFVLYFSLSIFFDLLNQFTRGLERLSYVAIAGVINTFIVVSLNILFLVVLQLGLKGYFLAYCLAFAGSSLYLIIKNRIWTYIDFTTIKHNSLQREMVKYSAPMILQNIGAWINNLSSRYVVTAICGSAANGIFSVAYKIPSLMLVFQTIFNQAWTISAVKSQEDSKDNFYDKVYVYYNIGFVLLCSVIICGNKIFAKILFSKDFYIAWKYAPFLIITVIFNSLAGLLGGILIAKKKTDLIAKTTIAGAIINLIFNIILVNLYGPIGAALGSLISYVVVWGTRLYQTVKLGEINISIKKDIIAYFVLLIQSIGMLAIYNNYMLYSVQFVCIILLLLMYRREVEYLLSKFFKVINFKIGKGNINE